MKWLLFLPGALAGLTGCAVYVPAGHHGAVYGQRAVTVHVQPVPVIVAPAPGYVRPAYRDHHRRNRDRDRIGNRRDRDRDGVPNGDDRYPDDPRRR